MWMPQNTFDDKSTLLVQTITWANDDQGLLQYDVTRPQEVKYTPYH